MRVGTVFSKCVRDIVEGRVDIEDVLIIIDFVGYNFNDSKEWDHCWYEYTQPTMFGPPVWDNLDRDQVYAVVSDLVYDRKIHVYKHSMATNQPFSWTPWLDLVIPDENLDDIPQLREAWEQYLFVAKLVRRG